MFSKNFWGNAVVWAGVFLLGVLASHTFTAINGGRLRVFENDASNAAITEQGDSDAVERARSK